MHLEVGQLDQMEQADQFSEFSADMYALTTSLFISLYKRPPILSAVPTLRDPLYSLLRNNPDEFWELDSIQNAEKEMILGDFSTEDLESLKDLIECGLSDQDSRITIDEWQSHEFWKDIECISQHEICRNKKPNQ